MADIELGLPASVVLVVPQVPGSDWVIRDGNGVITAMVNASAENIGGVPLPPGGSYEPATDENRAEYYNLQQASNLA